MKSRKYTFRREKQSLKVIKFENFEGSLIFFLSHRDLLATLNPSHKKDKN